MTHPRPSGSSQGQGTLHRMLCRNAESLTLVYAHKQSIYFFIHIIQYSVALQTFTSKYDC